MARILVLSDLWPPFPGGAEAYVSRLTDALVARGHLVHVLTGYAKAKSEYSLEHFDESEKSLQKTVREFSPEIILTHHFFAKKFAGVLHGIDIPLVEIVHSQPRHPSASFAIFNSQYTAGRYGWREGDMVMLPPVDERCVAAVRAQACIGHIKPIPNYPGPDGQLYGKGINLTYALARSMPKRQFLVLRGEWQAGEVIESLPNVQFIEPVADIRDFYARCRIVLMPSGHEDAGTVPLEAALNGIPCISSDIGGLLETNRGGIRLAPNDLAAWAKAIDDLDNTLYYEHVAQRQRAALPNWEEKFDEISEKICKLAS